MYSRRLWIQPADCFILCPVSVYWHKGSVAHVGHTDETAAERKNIGDIIDDGVIEIGGGADGDAAHGSGGPC